LSIGGWNVLYRCLTAILVTTPIGRLLLQLVHDIVGDQEALLFAQSLAKAADHRQRSASYSSRRPGFGCGVSAASITRRWRAQSQSFGGDQTPQPTNCVPAHAALVAADNLSLRI
jgi:hypothetical protein